MTGAWPAMTAKARWIGGEHEGDVADVSGAVAGDQPCRDRAGCPGEALYPGTTQGEYTLGA